MKINPSQSAIRGKLKAVKAEWDGAPAGDKKDSSLAHYEAAERAHQDNNDEEANRELDRAVKALA